MNNLSLLETDIFNYKTPEFYINMKSVPDINSVDRKDFVIEERKKCREGININGIYIPGGLYTHLNYYHLEGDSKKNPGKKEIMLPTLRDNEWIIFNDYDKCQKEGKIYPLFGGRQISKTETEVSLCLRELSLYSPTEAIALFANEPYKDNFVKKARTALFYGEKFIYVPNIDKDWSKNEIRFGITEIDNSIRLRGTLYIYNTQEGKKIQVGSGKTPSFLLFDEAAASPFKAVLDTMEPALLTDTGNLRCAPMITFTGGETDKAEDAKNLIENANQEKQFVTTLENGNKVGGRFMDGRYRKDCKKATTISMYTGIKTNTWIDDYPIMATDFEYAEKKIQTEREIAAKSSDKSELILKKIFFPLTLDDVFLRESGNKFPIEECKRRKKILEETYTPEMVEFYRDEKGGVKWSFSQKTPITKFPINPKDFKDAPVCVIEHPIADVPFGTYIIGIDPYNEDVSSAKVNSLGVIYVYKRMYSIGGEFQNELVATWAGRKKTVKEFHELCLLITEYYNAVASVIPENEDKTLIQYFFLKKKGHFLADTLTLSKQINQGTKSNREKGLSASTRNQKYYMDLMIADIKDEYEITKGEGENMTVEHIMGAYKVNDPMLLEEMIQYRAKTSGNGVHDGNYDRIIAYGHCLALARYYDIIYPTAYWRPSAQYQENKPKKHTVRSPFGNIEKESQNNLFIQNKKKSNFRQWK